jgi:hypothetical protein
MSFSRRRKNVGRFGAQLALPAHPHGHLLDKMGGGGNLELFALRDVEPGAGERRLDLCAGHVLRFHDALSPFTGDEFAAYADATLFWRIASGCETEIIRADGKTRRTE